MTDSSSLIRIIQQTQPDQIYNLAAQSHVAVSFEEPEYTADSDGLGTLQVLEAIRILGLEKKTRLARIKLDLQECLYLGNLDAKRDWGHAKDYVEMQWLMLQQDEPEDLAIATGVQYSVRDFVNAAGKELGMEIRWEGQGADENGYDARGKCIVVVYPRYFRPTEVETLLGDPTKAKTKLGWKPKISLEEGVRQAYADFRAIHHREQQ